MADIAVIAQDGTELAVREGDLDFPYRGNFTAHVTLADVPDALPSGRCTLRWHGLECRGYLLHIGTSEGETSALIVGGAGGLWKVLEPKYYANQPQVRLMVQEVLSAAGESLSPTSTASVLSQTMPSWPRRQDQAGRLLDALAEAAGALWRVLPDGSIFFGTDDFTTSRAIEDTDYQLLSSDPEWKLQTIAPLTAAGLLQPGVTFSPAGLGGKVSRVHFEDDGDEHTARIWYLGEDGTDDLVIAGMRAIIAEETRGAFWSTPFGGEVIQQRGDGTVDVKLDDRRMPWPTSVPYLVAAPGAKLTLNGGERCQISFASGDPRQPFVQLYEGGTGTLPVARKTDPVGYLYTTTAPVGMGGATVVVLVVWSPTRLTPLPPNTTEFPLTITGGSPLLSLP